MAETDNCGSREKRQENMPDLTRSPQMAETDNSGSQEERIENTPELIENSSQSETSNEMDNEERQEITQGRGGKHNLRPNPKPKASEEFLYKLAEESPE